MSDNLTAFDLNDGGVVCGACRMGSAITPDALAIMRLILGGELHVALAMQESPAVHEVNQLAMNAMEAHLERRIRSLGVFDRHL